MRIVLQTITCIPVTWILACIGCITVDREMSIYHIRQFLIRVIYCLQLKHETFHTVTCICHQSENVVTTESSFCQHSKLFLSPRILASATTNLECFCPTANFLSLLSPQQSVSVTKDHCFHRNKTFSVTKDPSCHQCIVFLSPQGDPVVLGGGW